MDDDDDSYLYLHLSMCTCICFIIFLVSKFVYLYSKTQSIGEYCDGEEEEGKENINLNCYQILNSWYVCLFIFPLVISIIITIFIVIWTHCVVSQFHLIFFIPIIIVTFQMCGVIVVESSWCLAKSSSPSTSFKFFCICLAFSYFLLSLRSL